MLTGKRAADIRRRPAWRSLKLLGEEAQKPRRQKAGIALGLLDRIVHPIMRRAEHDTRPHEEAGLLERELERIGMRLAIDKRIFGAGDEQNADRVIGECRIADRRSVEIKLPVLHR